MKIYINFISHLTFDQLHKFKVYYIDVRNVTLSPAGEFWLKYPTETVTLPKNTHWTVADFEE